MLERLDILLELGGPVLITLVALSIVSLSIIVFKSLQFTMLLGQGRSFVPIVLKHYRSRHYEDALRILARRRSPVARVMDVAIVGHARTDLKEFTVREEIERVAALHLERMRSYLRGLEVIGTLSPLLGLLGTAAGTRWQPGGPGFAVRRHLGGPADDCRGTGGRHPYAGDAQLVRADRAADRS